MLTAVIGLIGVCIGGFLTQALAAMLQRRAQRLEALVAAVAASGRVIGAHERLHDLLLAVGGAPPVTSGEAQRALAERAEAHAEWRAAHARAQILCPSDPELLETLERFRDRRADATRWVREYQRLGEDFRSEDYHALQHQSWEGMRFARYDMIIAAQRAVQRDTRWLPLSASRRRALRAQRREAIPPAGVEQRSES
jgi:uncharacterized membrane protein YeaQ/YmgE (transglycosylase-associated protein family)